MVGTIPIHFSAPILVSSSDDHVHLCLLALAERENHRAQCSVVSSVVRKRGSVVTGIKYGGHRPTASGSRLTSSAMTQPATQKLPG
jgi:hypothetical protein